MLRVARRPPRARDLIASSQDRGAGEVVFLDPTFNHRPELRAAARRAPEVNADQALRFFAEVRAEGLTPSTTPTSSRRANFTKLEIGLQSVNPRDARAHEARRQPREGRRGREDAARARRSTCSST